jgi:hypothetical protein
MYDGYETKLTNRDDNLAKRKDAQSFDQSRD